MSALAPFSEAWLDALIALVFEAGAAIQAVAEGGQLAVEEKSDASPVTAADHAAEAILSAGLRRLTPTWPQRSEEQAPPSPELRAQWSRFWLIDPLDGTKEFLAGNGEYTVNVALIEDGRPVLGLVGVPGQGRVYLGWVPAQRALSITAEGLRTALRARPARRRRWWWRPGVIVARPLSPCFRPLGGGAGAANSFRGQCAKAGGTGGWGGGCLPSPRAMQRMGHRGRRGSASGGRRAASHLRRGTSSLQQARERSKPGLLGRGGPSGPLAAVLRGLG